MSLHMPYWVSNIDLLVSLIISELGFLSRGKMAEKKKDYSLCTFTLSVCVYLSLFFIKQVMQHYYCGTCFVVRTNPFVKACSLNKL